MQRSTSPGLRALHVLVLVSFASSQPLFDLLGRHPEFLVVHGATPGEIFLLALLLAFALPGGCAALAWAFLRSASRTAPGLHLLGVALLLSAIALPVAKRFIDASAASLLTLACGAGFACAAAYARWPAVRSLLTVSSPVVILFPALFLFASPVSRLLTPQTDSSAMGLSLKSETSVVILIFDALPLSSLLDLGDQIAAERHPNFAALARRSHWFRNATTVSTHTNFAVPAILSSRYPVAGKLPITSEYPYNLFTALSSSFDFNVVEPITALCPVDLCARDRETNSTFERGSIMVADLRVLYLHLLLPESWTHSLPAVSNTWAHFASSGERREARDRQDELRRRHDDTRWILRGFLDGIEKRERPTLNFLHVNVPHAPYIYLASGKEYRPAKGHPNHRLEAGHFVDSEWAEVQTLQRHLLQVSYCDAVLGQIVSRLESEGVFDDSLVVVTADHGVSLRPGVESRQLTGNPETENVGDLLPIPLFIKTPGQRKGTVSDRNVELVDILPTILDVLGGSLPASLEGVSLLGDERERPRKRVFSAEELWTFGPTIPSRRDTVKQIYDLFDFDRDEQPLYRVGPHRELLGRRLSELSISASSPWVVRLAHPGQFDAVDLDSNFLPVHVLGEIQGPGLPEVAADLAISLNGTIRAVTRSFEEWERQSFTALLPESTLLDGRNVIEVFVVEAGPRGATLRATQSRPARAWIAVQGVDGRIALLISSDGTVVPVVPGAVQGTVSRSRGDYKGRILDFRQHRVGESVLMFSEGRFLHAHWLHDMDAEKALSREHFRFADPQRRVGDAPEPSLRFLGVSGGVASELTYGEDTTPQRLWKNAATLEVEAWGERETVVASSGDKFPVVHGSFGEVHFSSTERGDLVFSGHTRGPASPSAAVVVFLDGQLLGPVVVKKPDPQSKEGADANARASGTFDLELPRSLLGNERSSRIRFFTFFEGSAGELATVVEAGEPPRSFE